MRLLWHTVGRRPQGPALARVPDLKLREELLELFFFAACAVQVPHPSERHPSVIAELVRYPHQTGADDFAREHTNARAGDALRWLNAYLPRWVLVPDVETMIASVP